MITAVPPSAHVMIATFCYDRREDRARTVLMMGTRGRERVVTHWSLEAMEEGSAATQARQAQAASGYDEIARDQIRRALKRYMREHRIGAPAMQRRLIDADPRQREIPLSTLQRFLAGTHHTADHHVDLCYGFVKDLPYFAEDQDSAALAHALFFFFAEQMEADRLSAFGRQLEERFAGRYELRESRPGSTIDMPGAAPQPPPENRRTLLTLSPAGNKPWLLARETEPIIPRAEDSPERREHYEGVMVLTEAFGYLVMRNSLTRIARMGVFAAEETPLAQDEWITVLDGEVFDPEFLHESFAFGAGDLCRRQRVSYYRANAPLPAMEMVHGTIN